MATLSPEARQALSDLTRNAVRAALENRTFEPSDPGLSELAIPGGGCFVTLKTGDRLRGCLGCFTSPLPLWRTVAEYARHSTLDDPRFTHNRLIPSDWPALAISISVLSPLSPCTDPAGITLGRHGIYVRRHGRSGCFLPQVADETGWTIEEFWSHCCADKAGFAPDAWKDGTVECFTFTAEVFDA